MNDAEVAVTVRRMYFKCSMHVVEVLNLQLKQSAIKSVIIVEGGREGGGL